MVYFGTDYLKSVIQFLGENIVGVLTTIGGMLPAVGIALTLKSIFKGESVVFFFLRVPSGPVFWAGYDISGIFSCCIHPDLYAVKRP